jgi:hypothetical protein
MKQMDKRAKLTITVSLPYNIAASGIRQPFVSGMKRGHSSLPLCVLCGRDFYFVAALSAGAG